MSDKCKNNGNNGWLHSQWCCNQHDFKGWGENQRIVLYDKTWFLTLNPCWKMAPARLSKSAPGASCWPKKGVDIPEDTVTNQHIRQIDLPLPWRQWCIGFSAIIPLISRYRSAPQHAATSDSPVRSVANTLVVHGWMNSQIIVEIDEKYCNGNRQNAKRLLVPLPT